MKILYIAHRVPYPPNKGDKIRSFHEIRHLSRSHEVHLAAVADDHEDMVFAGELEKYCRRVHIALLRPMAARLAGLTALLRGQPLTSAYFHRRELQKVIDRWVAAEKYDVIMCFSSPSAEYLFRCPHLRVGPARAPAGKDPLAAEENAASAGARPTAVRQPKLVMDFCDVDSDKWRQYARRTVFPFNIVYFAESRLLLEYEARINRVFDLSIFVSQRESDLFSHLLPQARNTATVSNGVDFDFFRDPALPELSA